MEGFRFLLITLVSFCAVQLCCCDYKANIKCPKDEDVKTDPKLLGGWSKMKTEDVAGDPLLPLILETAVNNANTQNNGVETEVISKSDIQSVYTQLVNGLNYCIKFRAVTAGCEKHKDCTKNELSCEVGAYKPFGSAILVGGQPRGFDYGDVTCEEFPARARIIM